MARQSTKRISAESWTIWRRFIDGRARRMTKRDQACKESGQNERQQDRNEVRICHLEEGPFGQPQVHATSASTICVSPTTSKSRSIGWGSAGSSRSAPPPP